MFPKLSRYVLKVRRARFKALRIWSFLWCQAFLVFLPTARASSGEARRLRHDSMITSVAAEAKPTSISQRLRAGPFFFAMLEPACTNPLLGLAVRQPRNL
mmetsp:Transcript_20234/g.60330  ORF Transcript_20234/g.60330 Transcript_20234/m.60330 type:complete len:100 (-) Transcript_20234:1377-1676(-)